MLICDEERECKPLHTAFWCLKAVLAAEELVEDHCGIRFADNGLGAIDKEDDLVFELDLRGCSLGGPWQRLRLRERRDRRRRCVKKRKGEGWRGLLELGRDRMNRSAVFEGIGDVDLLDSSGSSCGG